MGMNLLFFGCQNEILTIDVNDEIIIPRTYLIPRADDSIEIDGNEDDSSWKKASFSEDFIDIEGEKIPNQKTRFKMLWDEAVSYTHLTLPTKRIV